MCMCLSVCVLVCVCVFVCCCRDIKSRKGLWGFHIDCTPARTAALWRNDSSIHHVTGHLYRQGRTAIQGGSAALCVCEWRGTVCCEGWANRTERVY